MYFAKLGRNWPSGSGEEDFLIFRYFVVLSHLEKSVALHLNKFESPSTNNAVCQVWLKLAQ